MQEIRVRPRSLVALGVALALSALALSSRTGADDEEANVVVWRDVTNAAVAVVSMTDFDGAQSPRYHVLDSLGQLWVYDYANQRVTPTSPGTLPDGTVPWAQTPTALHYLSTDCTGPSYIVPLPSRSTVGTPLSPNVVRIVPNNVSIATITAGSFSQGVGCSETGGLTMRAIRFDTLPLAHPRGTIGTPPFHPEVITLEADD